MNQRSYRLGYLFAVLVCLTTLSAYTVVIAREAASGDRDIGLIVSSTLIIGLASSFGIRFALALIRTPRRESETLRAALRKDVQELMSGQGRRLAWARESGHEIAHTVFSSVAGTIARWNMIGVTRDGDLVVGEVGPMLEAYGHPIVIPKREIAFLDICPGTLPHLWGKLVLRTESGETYKWRFSRRESARVRSLLDRAKNG